MNATSSPGHEIYIVEPDASMTKVASGWNHSEYLSAIGQEYSALLDAKVNTKH